MAPTWAGRESFIGKDRVLTLDKVVKHVKQTHNRLSALPLTCLNHNKEGAGPSRCHRRHGLHCRPPRLRRPSCFITHYPREDNIERIRTDGLLSRPEAGNIKIKLNGARYGEGVYSAKDMTACHGGTNDRR